jgi:oligoendopeptidase F
VTWARIPHFYSTPYYVYQYATCFAAAARLAEALLEGDASDRAAVRERYVALLRAGSSDYPLTLLQRAGVDLTRPDPVRAVVDRLDALVGELARAIEVGARG